MRCSRTYNFSSTRRERVVIATQTTAKETVGDPQVDRKGINQHCSLSRYFVSRQLTNDLFFITYSFNYSLLNKDQLSTRYFTLAAGLVT